MRIIEIACIILILTSCASRHAGIAQNSEPSRFSRSGTTEFTVTFTDSIHGVCRVMTPAGQPTAVVYMLHGNGQHQGTYREMARSMVDHGYAVVTYDMRGHGRSDGVRGHMVSAQQTREDLRSVIEATERQFAGIPRFLYGHSTGGEIALSFVVHEPEKIDGLILSAPLIRTAFEPSAVSIAAGKLLRNTIPSVQFSNEVRNDLITRDTAFNRINGADRYCHTKVTAAFLDILNEGPTLVEDVSTLSTPVLVMHGSADSIIAVSGSRDLANANPLHIELKLWNGYYHQIHNDLGKDSVFQFAEHWIDAQVASMDR